MESLLQVSDSSDDDNEEPEQITAIGTSVPAAAAVAATIQPPPAPAPPAAATGVPTSQSELSNRLKSLYSPANKAPTQQTTAAAPAPVAARSVQHSNTQQQQQQQQQVRMQLQQQQQQQAQPNQSQPSASSGYRPLVPNSRVPPQQQQQQQQQSSRSQSASAPRADPFEPTPLKTMIERSQKHKAAKHQHHHHKGAPSNTSTTVPPSSVPLRSSGASTSSTASGSSVSTTAASNVSTLLSTSESSRGRHEREGKARKEKFLMFTRVLMKYLEQKDPDMHLKAKAVIKECAAKNKTKEKGYESVTASMQKRLRAMVGDNYWTRAEQYLEHFLKQKKKIETKKSNSSSSQQSSSRSSNSSSKSAEQVAKERQMAAFQKEKLAELKRDQEKIRREAELKKRQEAAEKMRIEQKRKQQEQMARMAAKHAAEQQAKRKSAAKLKASAASSSMSSSSSHAAAAAARASPMGMQTKGVDAASSREYNELMQLVDHAVDYDWTSAALLLGREAKTDINLNTEQKRLLYGSGLLPPVQTSTTRGMEAVIQGEEPVSELPASMKGWGSRNVLSSRGAWARLRLREQREQLKRGGKQQQPPVVGGLSLPVAPQTTTTPLEPPVVAPEAQWFNEDRAEQDKTLAVVSEATQSYLKSILQKSIVAARQRENLDGIRLWHLQHGPSKPPMSLRLGCDVNRQVAQAQGNAAKTVQRMEEALARQTRVPAKARQLDNDETLYNATSMSDLSLRPELANAAEEADANAKRSFQVHGGKDATETAPFGRLPKRAKITAKDFSLAREWSNYSQQRKGIATPHIT